MLTEEEFYTKLAGFIKIKRKNLNLTNEKLAEISDMDLSKISLLQNSRQGCNGYSLYKILYSLDVNIFDDNIKLNFDKLEINIKNIKDLLKFLKGLKEVNNNP